MSDDAPDKPRPQSARPQLRVLQERGNRIAMVGTGGKAPGTGFGRKKYRELVDILRKTLMYQQVGALYEDGQDPETEDPTHVVVRMTTGAYRRTMLLIQEHGGWTLPPEEHNRILEQHKKEAEQALLGASEVAGDSGASDGEQKGEGSVETDTGAEGLRGE